MEGFKCCISMNQHSVNIFSEVDDFLCFFEGKGKYIPIIPGWKVDYSPSKSGYSITFIPHNQKTEFVYANGYNSLTVYGKIEDFRDGQALAYLGFLMMEAQRQRDLMVTCHAAALSKLDSGILILGERGDGKTSIAVALGRKYAYKLLANDLAIVGYSNETQNAIIYGGTKIFGLRLSAIRGRFSELLYLFHEQTKRSWVTKATVLPREIDIEIENNPQPLKKVFMIHLDSTKTDKLSVYKMDDLWVRNYLYENFSRYIRATAIVAFGTESCDFLDYIPSFDNKELHENRLLLIRYLINKVGILNISSGNLDEICETIDNQIS